MKQAQKRMNCKVRYNLLTITDTNVMKTVMDVDLINYIGRRDSVINFQEGVWLRGIENMF